MLHPAHRKNLEPSERRRALARRPYYQEILHRPLTNAFCNYLDDVVVTFVINHTIRRVLESNGSNKNRSSGVNTHTKLKNYSSRGEQLKPSEKKTNSFVILKRSISKKKK